MHVVLLCPLPHTVLRVRVLHMNYTQLQQNYPPDIRRKFARLVGNKITLRARIDSFHQNSDSSLGRKYKEEILQSLDKMVEASKKKRGGRRVRQVKEMFAITELRKQIQDLSWLRLCFHLLFLRQEQIHLLTRKSSYQMMMRMMMNMILKRAIM